MYHRFQLTVRETLESLATRGLARGGKGEADLFRRLERQVGAVDAVRGGTVGVESVVVQRDGCTVGKLCHDPHRLEQLAALHHEGCHGHGLVGFGGTDNGEGDKLQRADASDGEQRLAGDTLHLPIARGGCEEIREGVGGPGAGEGVRCTVRCLQGTGGAGFGTVEQGQGEEAQCVVDRKSRLVTAIKMPLADRDAGLECGGDIAEDACQCLGTVRAVVGTAGRGGDHLQALLVDIVGETDGVYRPLARGEAAVAEGVVSRFVASVRQHHGDLVRGRQAVELLIGEGEGAVEVGRPGGLEPFQGGIHGSAVAGRGRGQQQVRAPVEGDDGQRLDVAAQGGHLGEETRGGHAQPLGVGGAHAARVVEQQGHIHAPRAPPDGVRQADDAGIVCCAATDEQVVGAVQILGPAAGIDQPAAAVALAEQGLRTDGTGSGGRGAILAGEADAEGVGAPVLVGGEADEASRLAVGHVLRRARQTRHQRRGQQESQPPQPERS